MLIIKARVGDVIHIGDFVTVRITDKASQYVGMQFQADRSVRIKRVDPRGGSAPPRVLEEAEIPPTPHIFEFGPPARIALGLIRRRRPLKVAAE